MSYLFRDVINEGVEILQGEGIVDAVTDAWLLAEHTLGITRQKYYMDMKMTISKEDYLKYMDKIELRKRHIPLQHITGTQEFMGLEFIVNENVLIPRQDTEELVERAVKIINDMSENRAGRPIKVLDMCTGSGCIAVSIAKFCENVNVTAVDISRNALETAKINAERNSVHIEFVQSDLFENVQCSFDVIVSNPPYIPTSVIDGLDAEVRDHEPRIALDGSDDGLWFYKKITEQAIKHLDETGFILYEIGHDQGEAVARILRNIKPCVKVYKDLAGNDRVVVFGDQGKEK